LSKDEVHLSDVSMSVSSLDKNIFKNLKKDLLSKCSKRVDPDTNQYSLVVSTHLKKYESNWMISPCRGENKKTFETTTQQIKNPSKLLFLSKASTQNIPLATTGTGQNLGLTTKP